MSRKIANLVGIWEVRENDMGIYPYPKEIKRCVECGGERELHDFRCGHIIKDNDYHVDIHIKCVRCELVFTYGVVVNKKWHDRLKNSPLHTINLFKNMERFTNNKEIKRRLRELGYW